MFTSDVKKGFAIGLGVSLSLIVLGFASGLIKR